MKPRKITLVLLSISLSMSLSAQTLPYQNALLTPEARAKDLVSRLTLEEKSALMMNGSPAISRLGIPQFEWWSEALHGIGRNGFATVFPATIGMAASFNDTLLYDIYTAVSDEGRAKNNLARKTGKFNRYQGLSFWTPNINIFRDPRWGRGQETYGEDPYLTTRMGLAVVNGLQGQSFEGKDTHKYKKLLACAKHFAVHSGPEWNRHTFNIENLPERDLWETYLPAFKSLVQEGNVAEVMCVYQRIDGDPCCSNARYEQQILRDEWGFKGLITSDCGAISDFYRKGHHETVATPKEAAAKGVLNGTDVECGSVYHNLPTAVKEGLVSEASIDTSLVRLFTARFELGDFEPEGNVEWHKLGNEVIASKAHKELAYQIAQQSMVLLQNKHNLLPLNKNQKIVVMGPNANDSIMQWANYSGYPTETVTILEGIEEKIGKVNYIPACGHTRKEVLVSRFNCFKGTDGQPGLTATYWNNTKMEGEPIAKATLTSAINLSNGGNTVFAPNVNLENFSAKFEGNFIPLKDETLEMNLAFDDCVRLIIDNDTVYEYWKPRARVTKGTKTMNFKAGKSYKFQIDYLQNTDMAVMNFDIVKRQQTNEQEILKAVANAEVVIFAGGISSYLEGEEMKVSEPGFKGGDRTTIEFPQAQRDIIALLKKAGKRVVLVNCSGSAMALQPETENAEAILQAWYPGEQGGRAVADVLFGDYNPSGKLPITFYKNTEQLPDFLDYTMANRTYRYMKEQPLFAFGHGLSYTTFDYSKLQYKKNKIVFTIKNAGTRKGTAVSEIYIRRADDKNGPTKTLKGFIRTELKAGESKQLVYPLTPKDFEGWDETTKTMRFMPGNYTLWVGSSSAEKDLVRIEAKIK